MISLKHIIKVFPILIGALLIACSAQSVLSEGKSQPELDSLNLSECKAFTCVSEIDSSFQSNLKKQGKRMLQIYLIRHAKPNVKKNWFYSAAEAQQYVIAYNSVPIIPFDSPMIKAQHPAPTAKCLPNSQWQFKKAIRRDHSNFKFTKNRI